ncbi:50S ribosomal protein L24 [bacterium BMS3Bbin07]|nr:50S ribosomal protein L24 [Nitrospirota bacterium]GBE36241.1 50S ribosomal protein L24 [bacterium BMS3Bbin07]HDH02193.1 50S ribosomal protein L24 [Nitrospirota bacterium]
MGLKIKKSDKVIVISGKEKGKQGRILSIMPKKNRVIIERVNMIKRHMKPSRQYSQGGIIEKEGTLHISKIMLVCPRCQKPSRISNHILDDGRKVRLCKRCKEVIDQ